MMDEEETALIVGAQGYFLQNAFNQLLQRKTSSSFICSKKAKSRITSKTAKMLIKQRSLSIPANEKVESKILTVKDSCTSSNCSTEYISYEENNVSGKHTDTSTYTCNKVSGKHTDTNACSANIVLGKHTDTSACSANIVLGKHTDTSTYTSNKVSGKHTDNNACTANIVLGKHTDTSTYTCNKVSGKHTDTNACSANIVLGKHTDTSTYISNNLSCTEDTNKDDSSSKRISPDKVNPSDEVKEHITKTYSAEDIIEVIEIDSDEDTHEKDVGSTVWDKDVGDYKCDRGDESDDDDARSDCSGVVTFNRHTHHHRSVLSVLFPP